VNEWQANRDASRAEAQEHDDALRRQLEREPTAGSAPEREAAPAPRYEPEPLPSHPRPRINQWPVVKSIAIMIIAVVVLSALQLHGELGDAREFLKEDLSKGIPSYRFFPVSSEFSLNRIMTTTCRGGEITYTVDVAIPQSISGQQEIVELQQSPAPTRTSGEYWNWSGTIFTGQSISIAINYHSKSYYYQWELGPGDSGTTAQVPSAYQKYLGDCWKFTPGDPTIVDLAARIIGNTTNVFDKVVRAYQYIHQNIAYLSNSPQEPKSPTKTLDDRNGDCDDQSFLLGSLLRAQGVPAWMELGLLFDQSTNQWGGHAWLRVLIPLKNGGERVVNIDPANNEFLFRDPFRMTDFIDDGDSDHLQNYYVLWRYSYIGAQPFREDRFDSIYFRASTETTGVRGSGPSLSTGPQASLWKAPGFDGAIALMAMALLILVVRASGRRWDEAGPADRRRPPG
jgi:transglutaminase-like putative cysteine protease